jgi:hypothetical protein
VWLVKFLTQGERSRHTGIDGEIKNVNEAYSPYDRDDVNSLRLGADFEHGKEVSHNLFGPCQQNERYDGCNGTSDDEWPSLSPRGATSIALDADIRLDQCTRERAGNPNKGEERLANTQAE